MTNSADTIPTFGDEMPRSDDVSLSNWSALTSASFAQDWWRGRSVIAGRGGGHRRTRGLSSRSTCRHTHSRRPSEIGNALCEQIRSLRPHLVATLKVL